MSTIFGGHGGELCQNAGVYRSEYGDDRIIIEEGRRFPGNSRYWSKVNDLPDAQAIAGEQARQQFWEAFGE